MSAWQSTCPTVWMLGIASIALVVTIGSRWMNGQPASSFVPPFLVFAAYLLWLLPPIYKLCQLKQQYYAWWPFLFPLVFLVFVYFTRAFEQSSVDSFLRN